MTYSTQLARIIQVLTPQTFICCGYEAVDFSSAGAKSLTMPFGTAYAEVRIESSVITGGVVARYLNLGAGTLPTTTVGVTVYNTDFFNLIGSDSIVNFRICQTLAGTHIAHVQYFKNSV